MTQSVYHSLDVFWQVKSMPNQYQSIPHWAESLVVDKDLAILTFRGLKVEHD